MYCYKCGTKLEDGATACYTCGAPQKGNNTVVDANMEEKTYGVFSGNIPQPQPPQQPQYQPQYQAQYQPQYQPQPVTPPKKKKTGLIIALIAASLVVMAIIGMLVEKLFQEQGYGTDNGDDYYGFGDIGGVSGNHNTTGDIVEYTKGTLENGRYTNNWANLRVDITGDWTNGSSEEYAAYEVDSRTECGVIINDTTKGKNLTIGFEQLIGVDALMSEDEYLDVLAANLVAEYAALNLTCHIGAYSTTTIAGEQYRTMRATFDGQTLVQEFHVRKLDGYIIFVIATAQDGLGMFGMLSNINTVN